MKEKIRSSVKTAYSKFGLKAESIEKIVNIVEAKLTALGTQEADIDSALSTEILAFEPFVGIIQSEVDSRKVNPPAPAPTPTPVPTPEPKPVPAAEKSELEKKIELILADIEVQKAEKSEAQKKSANDAKIANAKKLLETAGAVNKKVLDVALSKIQITDEMTDEQISALVLPLYNTEYKEFYGDGSMPLPSQKNITTEEKKGRQESVVDFVKKYAEQELGVKQIKKD